jgi:uncharacterized protein YbjT (DUF2867 family)
MTDVATVFGGSGFIGRYLVRRLARAGKTVRVAVRDPEAALFLKTAGKSSPYMRQSPTRPRSGVRWRAPSG